ncbi:PE domain-containing protein [Mycobacterium camsae]|uniref:PE domain-containing protein n=1 Tax=Mycobacterium gordonae TaxID=1778 RepID=UPI00197DD363|nr:PE domain-containing protein [Mycobacterium gordonae]
MSSYVIAAPEAFDLASGQLTEIEQAIREAAAAAAPSTTRIAAAAADEVSAAIAKFFGSYAAELQTLAAKTTQLQAEFERALSGAGAAYAAAEAANALPLLAQAESFFAPIQSQLARDVATVAALLNWGTNAVGLGGLLKFPSTVAFAGPDGVTGVRIGFSFVPIPLGEASFLGIPLGQISYPAPALWYFPTQAGGSVNATGTTYLQHGFGAIGWLYQPLAMELATQTNSVVVAPTIPSIPLPFGIWLSSPQMQQGVGSLFLGSQPVLNVSASQAGFVGTLPQDFVLTGHSAGGNLATMAASNYLTLGGNAGLLKGVVMFDGVANNAAAFGGAIANLQAANIPVYTVAAPPQPWNAFGATTSQLASLYPGQFSGVTLVGGSHVDSMLGDGPVIDLVLQLVTGFSPPGNTAAVYTLATGWINDMYAGFGPTNPMYGIYGPGPTNAYVPPGGQQITLGQATGIVLP